MSISARALDTELDSPAAGPALGATVARRLSTIDVLPELRQTLLRLVAADEHWSAQRWQWEWVIPAAQTALGGPDLPIEPFVAAWALMYAAIVRLDQPARRARRLLIGWVLGAQVLLLAAVGIWRPTIIDLLFTFSDSVPVVLLAGFIASGVMLFRAYRQTSVAHVRRQVRLIALACISVAFVWALAFLIPIIIHAPILLADQRLNIIAGGVPLAYLVSGTRRDLYRIDRALTRLSVHMLTILALVIGLALVIAGFDLHANGLVLWVAVVFVMLYRPTQHMVQHMLPSGGQAGYDYRTLNEAVTHLTTSLDTPVLIGRIVEGVRATFNRPILAFYAGHIDGTNELTLTTQERMPYLPAVIAPGRLAASLARSRVIMSSRRLSQLVGEDLLHADEEQALRAPGVVVWCPIVHHDDYLLGVLLLGMRGDFDPYRDQDQRELQRLLDAAALALTNSAAYNQQLQAEALIHDLYQHLQEAQDATAAQIARELHDEIININVRLNVQSLERLLARPHEPDLRDELGLVLESERTVIQTLRLICEQLHPTGIDDPLGLASVLRMQADRVQSQWTGECLLRVNGSARPVSPRTQREAMRITREALTNAIKHADATCITIDLRYRPDPDALIELTIHDNGCGAHAIEPRPGHWGVRNMYESARMAGGNLTIAPGPDGGTVVIFRFAAAGSTIA